MPKTSKLTPAMRQYMEMKRDTPADAILLFRMGDFYELFFDDAKTAAPLMDIVLTKRNGVPMCGVPHHSYKGYVARLLESGKKVAIAEQIEDPKEAKGIVKRAVTQVITPGTVLDEEVLSAGKSNYLAAVTPGRATTFGIALMDVSTGDFRVTEVTGRDALENELHRVQPAECLFPESLDEEWQANGFPDSPAKLVWTPVEDWLFDGEMAVENLCRHFNVASLDGFGCRELDAAVAAAGAVFSYTRNSLRQDADHITSLQTYHGHEHMVLDRISQRNLELVEPIFADARGATLFSVLNRTITPMGSRMLREWCLRPLRKRNAVEQRLNAVEAFTSDPLLLSEVQETLATVRDLERTIVRLNMGSGNARDLRVLFNGLAAVPGLRTLTEQNASALAHELAATMSELPEVTELIGKAIVEEPPITITEGGIIREGYDSPLDDLRKAATDGKNWIASLQTKEQERTGIKSLKVRFNKVHIP